MKARDWTLDGDDFLNPLAYAIVVCTVDHAPILAHPGLARIAVEVWDEAAGPALLASVALPDQSRAVIKTDDLYTLNRRVETYKERSRALLLQAITGPLSPHADELLDVVTRYNPAWPGVIYRVWQDGYHLQTLTSESAVTKKVGTLLEMHGILLE